LLGSLPNEIRVFTSLKRVDFFVNQLSGTIPNVLTAFSGLEFFDIEENRFSGPAFVNLTGLVNLTTYRVSLNQFTGQIPQEGLADLTSLRELWIASNTLTGSIPPTISQLGSLGMKESILKFWSKLIVNLPHILLSLILSYHLCQNP
jgi:hypothetical protein